MTDKMPDEVWLGWNPNWQCVEHMLDGHGRKYTPADLTAKDAEIEKLKSKMEWVKKSRAFFKGKCRLLKENNEKLMSKNADLKKAINDLMDDKGELRVAVRELFDTLKYYALSSDPRQNRRAKDRLEKHKHLLNEQAKGE